MASGQTGSRRHTQTNVVPNEDLSGGGGGVGRAASQKPQLRGRCCCCMGAGVGAEGGGDGFGGRRGGRVGGGLEESRGCGGGSVCGLVGLVKGCCGAGEVQTFENTCLKRRRAHSEDKSFRASAPAQSKAIQYNSAAGKPRLCEAGLIFLLTSVRC